MITFRQRPCGAKQRQAVSFSYSALPVLCGLLLVILLFGACKSKQVATQVEVPVNKEAELPAWVRSRPVTDTYYIGIGQCPKGRADYLETAKKNALNDLASEISVTVEGNSLLYTLDRKQSFDEQYTSTIKTRTNEQLEGYELVDSYDGTNTYWTYYRLNKADYARLKAGRKQKAIDQATDLYSHAKTSLSGGDLKSAFDQDLRALIAMKDYWGDSDQVNADGKSLSLANQLFTDLQAMTSGVRLAVLPKRCALDYANHFKREMLITATYAEGGHALAQLPIVTTYPGISGAITESRNTDAEGHARTTVQRVDLAANAPEMVVRPDMNALVSKDLDPTFTTPLVGSLTIPEAHVPIDRTMPKVFTRSSEKNLGQPLADAGFTLAIKEALTSQGFRFTDKPTDADMEMMVTADTHEMGESNGFFTANLDASVTIRDRKSGETIYEGGRQSVKGIQLTYIKAGLDAYKKAGQGLGNDLVPALMNAILQQ